MYSLRITIAVPEALIQEANQLAMAIGQSQADQYTFDTVNYKDANNNRYAVASTVAINTFPETASRDLQTAITERYGEESVVNLQQAQLAQSKLIVGITDPYPIAQPNNIVAIIHPDPKFAIQAMNLDVDFGELS